MSYVVGALIGLNIGLIIGGFFVRHYMQKMLFKVAEESMLRTNLINWIISEGVLLDNDEFYTEYQERAKFINLTSG